MIYTKAEIQNGQLVVTSQKEIDQKFDSDCFLVQFEGLEACKKCEFKGTEECGGGCSLMRLLPPGAIIRGGIVDWNSFYIE